MREKSVAKRLQEFIAANGRALLCSSVMLILAYFRFIFSSNYRVDSIILLVDTTTEFNDVMLGRFGIVLLNRLFNLTLYNPYLISWLTLIMMVVFGGFFVFSLCDVTDKKPSFFTLLLPLIFFLHPVWVEQLYFSYQTFLVVLSLLFCLLSAYLVIQVVCGSKKRWLFVAMLLAFLAFAVYQAYVPLYLTAAVGYSMAYFIAHKDACNPGTMLKVILLHMAVFFAGVILYFVGDTLATIGVESTDYLTGQIKWGTMPMFGTVINILKSIASVIVCYGETDTFGYLAALIGSLFALILTLVIRKKEYACKPALVIAWILLQVTPFSMTILMASRAQMHTELTLPAMIAIDLFLVEICAEQILPSFTGRRNLLVRHIMPIFMVIVAFAQIPMAFRLFFTEDHRYQQDHDLAQRIIADVDRLGADTKTKSVVYIGEYDMVPFPTGVSGDIIGVSMFAYHEDMSTTNMFRHALVFAEGGFYQLCSEAEIAAAEAHAETMPSYPAPGSVVEFDDMIVVKLSDDIYYDNELLTPGYQPAEAITEESDIRTTHQTMIDSVVKKDDVIVLSGFSVIHGVTASEISYQVEFVDQQTGDTYAVNTARTYRSNVTHSFWRDRTNYNSAGIRALCPLELLESNKTHTFRVCLKANYDGVEYYINTDTYLSYSSITKTPVTGN